MSKDDDKLAIVGIDPARSDDATAIAEYTAGPDGSWVLERFLFPECPPDAMYMFDIMEDIGRQVAEYTMIPEALLRPRRSAPDLDWYRRNLLRKWGKPRLIVDNTKGGV